MNIDEIIKNLQTWQEEDEKDRCFIIMTRDGDESQWGVCGTKGKVCSLFDTGVSADNGGGALKEIFETVIERKALEAVAKRFVAASSEPNNGDCAKGASTKTVSGKKPLN